MSVQEISDLIQEKLVLSDNTSGEGSSNNNGMLCDYLLQTNGNFPESSSQETGQFDIEQLEVNEKFTKIDIAPISFTHRIIRKATERVIRIQAEYISQDFAAIRKKCLDSDILYEDPDFPANEKSLCHSRTLNQKYQWKRPKEICGDPKFFVKGVTRFDVKQGRLGNCWFLVAAANLTQDNKMFSRVVCEDNSFDENYAGIFHFRFWRFGKWIEIVIDDRLPTYNGKLAYMHSEEQNEFWSALLEKAYAKLHGSYEALIGGTTNEALQDFSGGITEMYDLKQAPPNLFEILMKNFERNSLMGCSIKDVPNEIEAETNDGLVCGHAYSITKVCLVDIVTPNTSGKIQLLRLRNPWGDEVEWKGAWSDMSREWTLVPEVVKQEIGLNFGYDGEFWMSFRDFTRYFDRVDICNLSPDALSEQQEFGLKKTWNMSLFEGAWASGISAGGCRNYLETFFRNPQYVIALDKPDLDDEKSECNFIVALMQKNHRDIKSQFLTIGFAIYQVAESDLAQKPLKMDFFKYKASVASSKVYVNSREVSSRFKLPPGYYLIVPSTYEPNIEGEYLIRVFSESANKFMENDEQIEIKEVDSRIVAEVSKDIKQLEADQPAIEKFFFANCGSDKEIDWIKLKQILDYAMRDVKGFEGFSRDICRSLVALLDDDFSGKLGLEEFKTLLVDIAMWKAAFELYDRDGNNKLDAYELREALGSAGYQLNNNVLTALVQRYGLPDKTIAFDDFIMCAFKVKTLIKHFNEKDHNNDDKQTKCSIEEWIRKAL